MPGTTTAPTTTVTAFHLLARGPQHTQPLLLRGPEVRVLGREGGGADLMCKDTQISRRHVEMWIAPDGSGVQVKRLPGSLNRVFLLGPDGQFHDQDFATFRVNPGQTFAIGSTYFTIQPVRPDDDPLPSLNVSFSPDVLRQARMPDLEARLQAVLSLPTVLARTTTEDALQGAALTVVRNNFPEAGLVALVAGDEGSPPVVSILEQQDRPGQGELPISRRLVGEALGSGRTVLYQWDGSAPAQPGGTIVTEPTWAVCLALGHRRRCLYVAGRSTSVITSQTDLAQSPQWQGDLKFLELVGSLLGSLLSARDLQARHALLQGFLPPPVLAWLETMPPQDQVRALAPTTVELTVMFCDLAGFSRLAERFARTPELFWKTVQHALSVMTQSIREQEGVVVDFQGDSVLAIWGWPETVASGADPAAVSVRRAARAALNIQQRFPEVQASFDELWRRHLDARNSNGDPPLLRCGVALTTGPVVVGYLGTPDMGGVDVFGHTVNRAARVQSLTRQFRAPILIDEITTQRLRAYLPAWCRIDPLLRVRLAGMDEEAAMISQLSLLETGSVPPPVLTPNERQLLDSGRWPELRALVRATAGEIGFRQFVQELLTSHGYQAPPGWNGVFCQPRGG